MLCLILEVLLPFRDAEALFITIRRDSKLGQDNFGTFFEVKQNEVWQREWKEYSRKRLPLSFKSKI